MNGMFLINNYINRYNMLLNNYLILIFNFIEPNG